MASQTGTLGRDQVGDGGRASEFGLIRVERQQHIVDDGTTAGVGREGQIMRDPVVRGGIISVGAPCVFCETLEIDVAWGLVRPCCRCALAGGTRSARRRGRSADEWRRCILPVQVHVAGVESCRELGKVRKEGGASSGWMPD